MKDRKRAWLVMAVCLILHVLCVVRFEGANGRGNIIYSSIFFVAGGLSMEIYLCHMFVYRVFEKLNLIHITGNEMVNYSLTVIVTITEAIFAAFCWSKFRKRVQELFGRK